MDPIFKARLAIKFNLTNIPQNATIKKATLSMHIEKPCWDDPFGYYQDHDVETYKMTKNWQENSNNWTTNWDQYGTAIEQRYLDQKPCEGGARDKWIDLTVTETVKNYHTNASGNFGFMVLTCINRPFGGYEGCFLHYSTSEASTTSNRPKLTVEYETGTKIVHPNRLRLPAAGPYQVTVTDVKGRKLADFSTNHTKYINNLVETLPAGVKLVHITAGEKKIIRKVVVR